MSTPSPATTTSTTHAVDRAWEPPPGLSGRLATVQNGPLGQRIVLTAFAFFLLGGVMALLMRIQLAQPENDFLSAYVYNRLFTMHGSSMMYLFVVPFLEGLATLILPQMLGARDMPFPRLTAFTFWTFFFGGILFYSGFLIDAVADVGWFAYVPLSGPAFSPDLGVDFWLLGLSVAEIGAIAGAIELITAIFKVRAPGMAISRLPLFGWAILVMAFSMLFAFTPLLVGSLFLELDRKLGTHFFNPNLGGNPLLWQHLFWIFGHPDVYIQFIPATGIVSTIVPVFVRRPIIGYTYIALAIVATGFLSFGLWVHHMFTAGLTPVAMAFFAAASMTIAIPSGVQIFAWIATIWRGRPVWQTPFLFVLGFVVIFVLGGLTGVMVAAVPFDWQVHDSYFVVAHFHYVLIGGVLFPIFAAIYYWMPKITGRLLDERLGRWNFWLLFVGFNVTFFPMHILGFWGMPRRVYTYQVDTGWGPLNLVATIGTFVLAAGVLVLLVNVAWSLWRGAKADANPWQADTLEWSLASPPSNIAFRTFPIVHSRHPLWDQTALDRGDAQSERLVQGLARWPSEWRAQILTSTLDGRPQEVFRVAGPSLWPMATSFGVMLVFAALIFDAYLVVAGGALLAVVSLIAWHWPERVQSAASAREEEEFERSVGLPVYATGSPTVSRWAMGLMITMISIVLATCLFSYFYLRTDAAVWPPPGIAAPGLIVPAIATACLLASGLPLAWGIAGIRQGGQLRLRLGLAASLLLGAAFFGLEVFDFVRFGFTPQTHAYGSIVYTTGALMAIVVLGGLGMNALVQLWAWRGHFSARRHSAVSNMALYWYYLLAAWLVLFATLYLYPHIG